MKKYQGEAVAIACFFFALAGCSKQVDISTSSTDVQDIQTSQYDNLMTGISPIINFFKTPFVSQINTTIVTDSSILIFDFIEKKSFTRGEKKIFTTPFWRWPIYQQGMEIPDIDRYYNKCHFAFS
jgi:hypothetical protein